MHGLYVDIGCLLLVWLWLDRSSSRTLRVVALQGHGRCRATPHETVVAHGGPACYVCFYCASSCDMTRDHGAASYTSTVDSRFSRIPNSNPRNVDILSTASLGQTRRKQVRDRCFVSKQLVQYVCCGDDLVLFYTTSEASKRVPAHPSTLQTQCP